MHNVMYGWMVFVCMILGNSAMAAGKFAHFQHVPAQPTQDHRTLQHVRIHFEDAKIKRSPAIDLEQEIPIKPCRVELFDTDKRRMTLDALPPQTEFTPSIQAMECHYISDYDYKFFFLTLKPRSDTTHEPELHYDLEVSIDNHLIVFPSHFSRLGEPDELSIGSPIYQQIEADPCFAGKPGRIRGPLTVLAAFHKALLPTVSLEVLPQVWHRAIQLPFHPNAPTQILPFQKETITPGAIDVPLCARLFPTQQAVHESLSHKQEL